MKSRRDFFKTVAAASALGAIESRAANGAEETKPRQGNGRDDRQYWLSILEKIAAPVLLNLSRRELRKKMPVETSADANKLRHYTHLEATARTLVGLAPWLELRGVEGAEARLQKKFVDLAQRGLDAATDPKSADFMNFKSGEQPLVDAAFLAQAILRAPTALWKSLERRVQRQIADALNTTRDEKPINNNHVLFGALVETALLEMGEPTVEERLEGYL